MPLVSVRLMNRVARTLFLVALGCFVAFHFVHYYNNVDPSVASEDDMGWKIWDGLVADAFRHFSRFDVVEMIACSVFLTGTLLLVSSPLLVPVLSRSRLTWWIYVLTSGAAMLSLGGEVILQTILSDDVGPGPGMFCLSGAMYLNLLGFFFIRREIPPNPVVDPA